MGCYAPVLCGNNSHEQPYPRMAPGSCQQKSGKISHERMMRQSERVVKRPMGKTCPPRGESCRESTTSTPRGSAEDHKAIADLVRANDRLGLNIRWASELKQEIGFVYAAGKATGMLPGDPAPATVYEAK